MSTTASLESSGWRYKVEYQQHTNDTQAMVMNDLTQRLHEDIILRNNLNWDSNSFNYPFMLLVTLKDKIL